MSEGRGHYVQFIYDFAEQKVLGVGYVPDLSMVPANAFQMMIVCDFTGRVVVRSLVNNQPTVIGTTVYRDDKLGRREQLDKGGPTDPQWQMIEKAIAEQRRTAQARRADLDPGAVDNAVVVHADGPKEGLPAKILGWIGAVVLLALIAVGWYLWANRSTKERANGESCTKDEQCASGWCSGLTCELPRNLGNGERCSIARDCASGRCNARGVCVH